MPRTGTSRIDTLHCPRCGYDVRAATSTWIDACPLVGTCTECGLEFKWQELFHPEKFEPMWCVEFAPGLRDRPIKCVLTLGRSLFPWTFCKRMSMSYYVRWSRLSTYVAFLILLALGPIMSIQIAAAIITVAKHKTMLAAAPAQLNRNLAFTQQQLANDQQQLASFRQQLRSAVGRPINLRFIDSLKDQQKKLLLNVQQRQSEVARIQQAIKTPPYIDRSTFALLAEAVVRPFARSSKASIIDPSGMYSGRYIPPRQLLADAGGYDPSELTALRYNQMLGAAPVVIVPLLFVFLPISRRRAHVRWVHIGRMFVYSLVILVAQVWLICGFVVYDLANYTSSFEWMSLLSYFLAAPLLCIAWTCIIKLYLRMRHAVWVATLLTLMSYLFILVVSFYIWEFVSV